MKEFLCSKIGNNVLSIVNCTVVFVILYAGLGLKNGVVCGLIAGVVGTVMATAIKTVLKPDEKKEEV